MASDPEPRDNSDNSATKKQPVSPPGLGDMIPVPFEPGQIIQGRYELIRLIGSGGVGFVVAAHHTGFDDLVALKFLRPEFATNVEAVSRFTIEARASFKLRSEHVARVLDVDLHEGTPFLAMELLEGTDLRGLLEQSRVLEPAQAVDYALQVCEALAAAHAIGVIHRDIKPENLFVLGDSVENHHLKVLDFGISKVALVSTDRATQQALTRVAVGTPPYMSPEQVRASRDLDARSDLWSVGCVLYELLTGTAPFERLSLMQSCAAVLEEEPPPAAELRHAIPKELSDAIMRCLRKDPEARFSDVGELAEAIGSFGSGRYAAYPARCRAHLNGEGLGRRSTPTSLTAVGARRVTGAVTGATSGGPQAIAVRLGSNLALRASEPPPARASITPPRQLPVDDSTSVTVTGLNVPKSHTGRLIALAAAIALGGLVAVHFATRERPARLVQTVQPRAAAPAAVDHTLVSAGEANSNELPTAALPTEAPIAAVRDGQAAGEKPTTGSRSPSTSSSRAKPKSTRSANAKATAAKSATSDPDVGF